MADNVDMDAAEQLRLRVRQQREQQQQQQRRIVTGCVRHVPDDMNMDISEGAEGYNLMTVLYKTKLLSDYLTALNYAAGHYGFDEHHDEVEFNNYLDFECEENVKIDPETGRITFLWLSRHHDYFTNGLPFGHIDIPPIIEFFSKSGRYENFEMPVTDHGTW
jgi:hypothetical protein